MDLLKELESINPALYITLQDIKKFCLARWEVPYLPWFTNHDVAHSEEIIHLLGQLIKPIKSHAQFLNDHELFILLAAAYLHDMGMQSLKIDGIAIDKLTSVQYSEIRKRHSQESFNVILSKVMTVERDNFRLPESIDDDYVSPIAFVSKGHSTDYFDEVIGEFKKNPPTPKNRPIRAELLTSLLLIADELDLHNKRIDFSKKAHFDISSYTQLHWFKHHYVDSVLVDNGTINIVLTFPQNSDVYKGLIQRLIESKLVTQINKVNPIIKKETSNLVHIDPIVNIQIREDSTGRIKRSLPAEVLTELKNELGDTGHTAPLVSRSEKTTSAYPKPSSIFTGRVAELKKFEEAIAISNFISIEGLGGFGKTEFAAKCIESYISMEKVVWFDCFPDSKLDTLIGLSGYADVLKGESKTELAKYSGFTDLIVRDERIIFLDNFHDASDPSFKEFFKFSEKRLNNAKIVLITRERPDVGVRIAPVNISGLKDDAAEFAKKLKVTFYSDASVSDKEIRSICDSVDGHPLAIELALQLICYGESPEDIVKKIVQAEDKSADLSHRLLDEIFNHPKSTEQEKNLMLRFSVFRGEVHKRSVSYLLNGESADATLRKLIDKKMIAFTHDRLSTHPLVREFCYKRLENKRDAHLKAAEYFKTNRIDKFVPVLEEEIAHHLLKGEYFEELADLVSEKGEGFILAGNTNSLKDIITALIAREIVRPIFYVYYGDIATIRGDWNDASIFYEKAFSLKGLDKAVMAEAYIKYGEMLYRKGNVKESLKYFEDAVEICKKNSWKKEEARGLNDIGLVHRVFGDLSLAEGKLNEALAIRKEISDKQGIAISLGNIGMVLRAKGDLKGALDKYNESLLINTDIGAKQGIATSLGNIGTVLKAKGDLKGALDKYNESLMISKDIGAKQDIASVLAGIGTVINTKGDLKGALDKYNESLMINRDIGAKQGIANSLDNIGAVFLTKEDLKEALDKHNESLLINRDIGAKQGIATSLGSIGSVLKAKGDLKGALDKYNESLLISKDIGAKQGIANAIGSIGSVLKAKGDLKGALDKYNESLMIKKEISDKQGIATSLGNIGTVLQAKGDLKGALEKYSESLRISRDIGAKQGIAASLYNMGTFFYGRKDYKLSLKNLFESLALKSEMGIPVESNYKYILYIRKELGLNNFKKLSNEIFDDLPNELKPFVNLEEFFKDTTVHYESSKVGRNDPCTCGSGKKYKRCCGK